MDAKQTQLILGRVIQDRRRRLGFSQESFADHIGVHRTYIGSVERGERNLTLKNLLAIARGLGIPPSTLLGIAEAELTISKADKAHNDHH